MTRLQFLVHGLPVHIETAEKSLIQFLSKNLAPFATSEEPQEEPYLVSISHKKRIADASDSHIGIHKKVGWDPSANSFYLKTGATDLVLRTSTPWHMEVSSPKEFLENFVAREGRYALLFNEAICAPIFMQLLLRWNIVAIAGTAVKTGSKATVIIGLDHEQRTSYARQLGGDSMIISPHMILTDGERIFPFPQRPNVGTAALPIEGLHFLVRAHTSELYPLHAEQSYHMLRAANTVLQKTPETKLYASLVFADPTRWQALFDNDHETLKKICERNTSFKIFFSG